MARLQKIYRDEIVAKLMTSLAVTNPMQVPKITKISVNMGAKPLPTRRQWTAP